MAAEEPTDAERYLANSIRRSPEITAAIERAEDAGHTGGRTDRPVRHPVQ